MADLVISANITHPDSSACFERLRRFGGPTEEIFDDCIRSMRFVPKSCDIARYSNERMRHWLHHGGVGPVVRGAHSASKARRIILVGDSHMRFLAYGLLYRLSGNETKERAQFRLPLVKEFSPVSLVGEVELHYCEMRNPAPQLIEECLAALKFGGDDILVAGSAAWPLATVENGQIQNPQEYRVGVQGVRDVLVSALGAFPALKIFWMSSTAKPLTDSYYWQSTWDHRNDGLNSMLNDIARGAFVNTPVKIFDVFKFTLPMNIASVENAHYNLFVAKGMVDVLLSDIVT